MTSNKKDYRVNIELNAELNKVFLARSSDETTLQVSKRSPIPQITDFNIWNRPLSTEEMLDWTSCK